MIHVILLCGVMMVRPPAADDVPAQPPDLEAYRQARATVGRDAEGQVRLALWCEEHGLTAERMKHLALATLIDPSHAAARGLLGLISYQGKWQRPDEVSRDASADPARKAILQDYLQRRVKAQDKADDQWRLALWCEQNGLNEQALAHLHRVVQLDPRRDAVWRRLGYKKTGARWTKPELLTAEKAELEAQTRANKFWKPRLEHLREALGSRDQGKRAAAAQAVSQITDPRAVPMVWTVFARGNEASQRAAVQILGQVDAPGASRALCLLSLFSSSVEIRRSSIEILRRRDPREFAALLVGMIRDKVKYKVNPVHGPGSPGVLTVEGDAADTQRRYSPPPSPTYIPAINDTVFPDASGQPVIFHPLGHYTVAEGQGIVNHIQAQMSSADRLPSVLAQAGLGPMGQQIGDRIAANARSSGTTTQATAEALMRSAGPTPSAPHGFDTVQLGVPYAQIPIGQMMAASQATAMLAQQQLEADVKSIEELNTLIAESNSRALQVLREVSGSKLRIRSESLGQVVDGPSRLCLRLPDYSRRQADCRARRSALGHAATIDRPEHDRRPHRERAASLLLRRGNSRPNLQRSPADRGAGGRRPGVDPEHDHRHAQLPAGRRCLSQSAERHVFHRSGQRNDRGHGHSPILEGRTGMGHGTGVEAR